MAIATFFVKQAGWSMKYSPMKKGPHKATFLILGGAVLTLALMPFVGDNYLVRLATSIAMYAAMACAWNFIGGYAGYPSFATAAFFGIGAYIGAIGQNAGIPMIVAWAVAMIVTALLALPLGALVLRLRGHYFAVGSIALVEICRQIASTWRDVTGGGMGLNVAILRGGPDFAGMVFLFSMLTLAILAFVTMFMVQRGRLGFGLRCIRQNEDAASMVGIDTNLYKSIAFSLSALFTAGAGAIYASWVAYIDPTDAFSILLTLKVPVMVMLGGAGTLFGPLIGVLAFIALEETIWSSFLELHQGMLGVIVVLLIFLLPGGLLKLSWPKRGQAR